MAGKPQSSVNKKEKLWHRKKHNRKSMNARRGRAKKRAVSELQANAADYDAP